MSTQNVNVARFARNVEWDFFCDFQTPCCKKLPKERIMIGQLIYFGLFEEKWGRNTCEWNTREESLQALASLKCIHRKCNTELHNYYSTASRFFFLHRCCNSNIFQRLFSRFAGYSLFRRFLSCFCCCYCNTLFEIFIFCPKIQLWFPEKIVDFWDEKLVKMLWFWTF